MFGCAFIQAVALHSGVIVRKGMPYHGQHIAMARSHLMIGMPTWFAVAQTY